MKYVNAIFILISTLFIQFSLQAQERQGLLLNASLTSESDDNVLRKVEATSDTSAKLSPQLLYLEEIGKHLFLVKYQGDYAVFNDNSKLNYDDHDLSFLAKLDHNLQMNSEFKLRYQDEIETPGSNNSTSLALTQFNQTTKTQAAAKLYYGTKESIGQLVLGLNHDQYRYTNNQQDFRDLDRNRLTGTFFYRIAPKTRLLFQATLGDYDYLVKSRFPDQSSKENFYLAGVEWDITAKTSGTFKLGYQSKDFVESVYNDITGLSYMLDMTWKPNTYSKIKFGAQRLTQESSQALTSAFVTTSYSVDAEHEITTNTKLNAKYIYDNDDIVRSGNRTDKRHNVSFAIEHNLLSWLYISLHYQYIERSSDLEIYNFKTNVVGLSLATQFE